MPQDEAALDACLDPPAPPPLQALAQHVARFGGPAPGAADNDAHEALSAALQCCHALMTRGGMEPLLAAPGAGAAGGREGACASPRMHV
jgi:hypothetical protein